MINLNVLPNPNTVDISNEDAKGALVAQLIIFYIGMAAFIFICVIPPFTLLLPVFVPIIIVVFIAVNVIYIIKFWNIITYSGSGSGVSAEALAEQAAVVAGRATQTTS